MASLMRILRKNHNCDNPDDATATVLGLLLVSMTALPTCRVLLTTPVMFREMATDPSSLVALTPLQAISINLQ
jgi:hypothetical protein